MNALIQAFQMFALVYVDDDQHESRQLHTYAPLKKRNGTGNLTENRALLHCCELAKDIHSRRHLQVEATKEETLRNFDGRHLLLRDGVMHVVVFGQERAIHG